jgi:two-component system sensor histidine kinase KdpD
MTAPAATRAVAASRRAHVLVCVAGGEDDLLLMRQAWSWAGRLGAALTVLHVLPDAASGRHEEAIAADRTFAAALGAPLVELPAFSVLDGIAEFAAERGATQLVLSEPRAGQHRPSLRPPLSQALAARLPGIEVLIFNRPSGRSEA